MRNITEWIKGLAKKFMKKGDKQLPPLQIERPNRPEEWDQEYLKSVKPVPGLRHPVARLVAELTAPGDVLLEAGCGTGELSAELAHAGRQIVLADFSEKILARAVDVFSISKLPHPQTVMCNLTVHPLPWSDGAVDWVWSSGVLEHWTDEELIPIVREMARIARKGVISLVPNTCCLFYRWGKAIAEARGTWKYGREIPRQSLKEIFSQAGLSAIEEHDCWHEHAPQFLEMVGIPGLTAAGRSWWDSLPADDPVKRGQGYLLLTLGRKA
jgi:SAM-dependent methyltransferase